MKTQKIIILMLGLGTLLALNFSSQAADAKASPSLGVLKSVPAAELPGKAAALVAAAKADDLLQTTIDVVKSAVGLNPAAVPAIVGSVASSTPSAAATAAATAASMVPKQAAVIAQAAAAAAPKQAGKIVEAVCRAVPNAYKTVATAVAAIVPAAAREILAGVSSAVPSLKEAINNALALYKGETPSVSQILVQTAKVNAPTPVVLAVAPQGINPTPHPAPWPDAPPVLLQPTDSTPVPTGGHQYANPTPTTGDRPL